MTASENLDRLDDPRMDYYKSLYFDSPRWDGHADLTGKRVLVYCEQGYGDVIQSARHFRDLRDLGCHLTLHCAQALHRLLAPLVDAVVDKDDESAELPEHDCHVLSLSLPFHFHNEIVSRFPYLPVTEAADLGEHAGYFKIGIAWEGNPEHDTNPERCCPLEYFAPLAELPHARLFMLQHRVHDLSLTAGCDDLDLYSSPMEDLYDVAVLINAMDLVISVDTAVLHLAGALNKRAAGLLAYRHDRRWAVRRWYSSVQLLRQASPYDWDSAFRKIYADAGVTARRLRPPADPKKVLLTGGIGDVIALESHMGGGVRGGVEDVYYATRAEQPLRELFAAANVFPRLVHQESLWDDFSDNFAFYSKAHCEQALAQKPTDWDLLTDWSIFHKFAEVNAGRYQFSGSSFLAAPLADVSGLGLPERYFVIAPFSDGDSRMADRNFDMEDWEETMRYVEESDTHAVVLAQGDFWRPTHERVLDLVNQTSITEAVEVLKGACGYVGVDSFLSVLAAQLPRDPFVVKSNNKHLAEWKHVYFAPRTDFSFVMPAVKLPATP